MSTPAVIITSNDLLLLPFREGIKKSLPENRERNMWMG
jgi:hypothetical protein